jgi:dienelactone hydrolase
MDAVKIDGGGVVSRLLSPLPAFSFLFLVALWPFTDFAQSSSGDADAGPRPSGSYAVGRTVLYCRDQHRTDPVAEDTTSQREFMVIVWYPADVLSGATYAPWMPAPWTASETDLLYYHRRHTNAPLTREQAEHAIRDPLSHSVTDAKLARTGGSFPVILFAPGAGVNSAFYSTFTEDLASHGYVVFGIEPTGWVSTRFPDGHTTPFSNRRSDDPAWFAGTAFPLWAGDLRFTLDQAATWNNDASGLFFHRLNLTRVGAFGHSFGGGSSILAALDDARIQAVLNLDGSPFDLLTGKVFGKPLMVIKHNMSPKYAPLPSDEHGKAVQAQVEEELSSLYLKGSPGYRVDIAEAQHMTFSDMAYMGHWAENGHRLGINDSTDGAATVEVVRRYIRAFFDRYLWGRPSRLLVREQPKSIATLSSTQKSR